MVELHRICSSFVCCVKNAGSDHTVCLACTFVKIHIWGRLQMFSSVLCFELLAPRMVYVGICLQANGRGADKDASADHLPAAREGGLRTQKTESQEISRDLQDISTNLKQILALQAKIRRNLYISKKTPDPPLQRLLLVLVLVLVLV